MVPKSANICLVTSFEEMNSMWFKQCYECITKFKELTCITLSKKVKQPYRCVFKCTWMGSVKCVHVVGNIGGLIYKSTCGRKEAGFRNSVSPGFHNITITSVAGVQEGSRKHGMKNRLETE